MANFKEIIEESFAQYAGSVIQSRALVDVRDCIKPSARQIFYAMEKAKQNASHPYQKTLRCIASSFLYYIHGDSSVEGIIMRAGQPFSFRYPLVQVQGSYGNLMESGNWAAPRYSESRLSPLSAKLFESINKNTIEEWRDNFDDTDQYPSVLPTKGFYNIVNGTFGIATGLASSIPSFNLIEVNKALITLLNNPEADFDEIYCEPDFPTGGIIVNGKEIKESLRNGNGKACKIRAKFDYDKKNNILTVVEMPYGVYTNTICQQLEKIVNGEDNPGIKTFNDLTGSEPNIKIYLDKGVDGEYIKNYLFNNTSLQSSYGINLTMLDMGKHPKLFTWKEALLAHLAHQKIVYRREYEYDLKKIEHDISIAEAIIKAIQNIEEVIKTIKSSTSAKEANESLQKLLNINEEQAKAILDIKLARLARLEIEKYEKDLAQLKSEQKRIIEILNNEKLFINEIIKGYEEVAKKYGDERRTEITNIDLSKSKEEKEIELIEPEKVVVTLTEDGCIKRIPASSFRAQRRNGKGVKNAGEITSSIIKTNTQDSLMIFSDKARLYRILVNDIPEGVNTKKGVPVKSLIEMEPNENPILIYSIYRNTDAKYVLFTTKNGLVKKTSLEEYTQTRKKTGLAAIKLKEEDELVSVSLINEEEIILLTHAGMAIRIDSKEIGAAGRMTTGVKGITLKKDDYVIAALPIRHLEDQLAIISETGMGKRLSLNELTRQGRAGKGLMVYKGGYIACATLVTDGDMIFITGSTNNICIKANEIPILRRGTIGNQLIKGTKVIGVSKV